MPFVPAVKETLTLKMTIAGIAGTGKSFNSFLLASLLANGERFAVIDAENRKARIYADIFKFDVFELDVFSLGAYAKAVKEADAAGYKVLVIDGLSQLWEGKNGLKDQVEMIARRDRITTFAAWQQGNNLLSDFIKMILDLKMHVICTLRSKIDYSNDTNKDGKLQYRRSGLAPIFKENFEYEFLLYAEMDHEHRMTFYKSMCRELSGKVLPMAQEGEAKRLVALLQKWMEGTPSISAARTSQVPATQAESTCPTTQPQPVRNALEAKKALAIKWAERLQVHQPLVEAMTEADLNDKIEQYKKEYAERQQNAKAEAAARAELVKQN